MARSRLVLRALATSAYTCAVFSIGNFIGLDRGYDGGYSHGYSDAQSDCKRQLGSLRESILGLTNNSSRHIMFGGSSAIGSNQDRDPKYYSSPSSTSWHG